MSLITKELPTIPGLYWYRRRPDWPWKEVELVAAIGGYPAHILFGPGNKHWLPNWNQPIGEWMVRPTAEMHIQAHSDQTTTGEPRYGGVFYCNTCRSMRPSEHVCMDRTDLEQLRKELEDWEETIDWSKYPLLDSIRQKD